jgi:branched-chain amino acid transport system permease protein
MAALGFNVTAHRVAAYTFASVIAAIAGILMVWLSAGVSPGAVAIGPAIDILVIAVVGGLRHPIGPFIGALIYVLLRTFALDVLVALGLGSERFQLLIGLGFLAIVFWSPDGVLGLWQRWRQQRDRVDPLMPPSGSVESWRGALGEAAPCCKRAFGTTAARRERRDPKGETWDRSNISQQVMTDRPREH